MSKSHTKLVNNAGDSVCGEKDVSLRIKAASCLHETNRADLEGIFGTVEQVDGQLLHGIGDQSDIFFYESALGFGKCLDIIHEYSSCYLIDCVAR